MKKIYDDNSLTIGNTPLVKLNRITDATIYAKIESRNPAGSVKCRIGASMIWAAEKSGKLKPGMTLVEPTSGNTGIALAFVAAARGYGIIFTMPHTMSLERRKLMKALGADIVITDAAIGIKGAIAKAEEIVAGDPSKYLMPSNLKIPPTLKSTKKPPVPRSGTIPRAALISWSVASVPAAPSAASPAISRKLRASRLPRWR